MSGTLLLALVLSLQLLAQASLPQLFDQALNASRDGRFAEALPLWNQVLEIAPEDAAAWSNRGNVQLALGDPEAAISDQGQAIALEPASPDPRLNRGTAEEALQRWEAAEADYLWIIEQGDEAGEVRASALYNLGNVRGSQGDWSAAHDCFMAAAEARPGFAMARSSAALAAFQLGESAEAERELRALIRRYPLFADARAGLTALLWRRGASGEAESNWAAASGLDPRYRQPDWLLHTRRWPPEPVQALQRWDAAEADYLWILQQGEEAGEVRASALYNLGNVRGSQGDWSAAHDCFVAAAEARPGFAMARSSAALVAFQLGDPAEAERELRALIRRHPLFADARAGLTALLWRRGASGEAESNWAAASGLDPRYRQPDWLLHTRRWPPEPVQALQQFLTLASG